MINITGLLVSVIFIGSLRQVQSFATTKHEYKTGDPITVYGNKVGTFSNPSETYTYYTLPYCSPDSITEKKLSFGEMLNGDRLVVSPYTIQFLVERASQVVCRKNLTVEELHSFRTAVARDYYTLLYVDDLPIWSFVGKVDLGDNYIRDEFNYFIYTHLQFEILYNGNFVTEVSLRTDHYGVTDITTDKVVEVEFSYTIKWTESNTSFEDRMQKYTLSAHLPRHMSIHKLSIMNSSLTILVLIGCLMGLYICILKRDFYNGAADEEKLVSNHNETGWKALHGDVFRYPKYKYFFVAAVGCGVQLLTVMISIILLGYAGVFRLYDRGGIKTAMVFTYAATCGFAGFTSISLCHQLEETNLVRILFPTGSLLFGPLALAFCVLNTIAATYGTTIALPFTAITIIFLVWILLALPSFFLGGFLGKLLTSKFQAPCPTRDIPRQIPTLRFYRGLLPQMLLGGFLPFGVIYLQLYYIFTSVWGHRIYTVYGLLFVVFILLVITIALVSVGLTYFQLAAEDHQWWWRSFLCGGSTGLYVYAYCCFYYMERSNMNSFMQVSFFFGYMSCICYGLFLMSGSVAFGASFYLFVTYIVTSSVISLLNIVVSFLYKCLFTFQIRREPITFLC